MEFDYQVSRVEWAKGDAIRDAGLTTPDDIVRYDDLQYGPDAKWNVLDIYRPKNKEGYLPVIISVHGGGWFYGDKELYQHYCMRLAQRGFAVVNYTYRLAPEHKYPAPLEDSAMVFDFVAKHKDEYQLDINNTFMVGDSAGAQLNYQINIIRTSKEYAAKFDFKYNDDIKVRAIALNCGVYTLMVGPNGPMATVKTYLKEDWKADRKTYAYQQYVNRDFPSTFVMSGRDDFLKVMAKPLYWHLRYKGVKACCKIYTNRNKEVEIGHVFHVDCNHKLGQRCNDEECDFFRKHMV